MVVEFYSCVVNIAMDTKYQSSSMYPSWSSYSGDDKSKKKYKEERFALIKEIKVNLWILSKQYE